MQPDAPTSAPDSPHRGASPRRTLLFAAWAGAIITGFSALIAYEMTPGNPGHPPSEANEGGNTETPTYTLVMAAHPRCPCTRASMSELASLMTRLQGRLTATVWFYTPADAPADWAQTGLWKSAAALPGVSAKADPEGQMARQLGAETSGQALLFDPAGRRVFAGGITGARGHEGANEGVRTVEALVLGQTAEPATTPVFGCAIRDNPPTPATRVAEASSR